MGDKKNAIRKLQLATKSIKLTPILDLKEYNLLYITKFFINLNNANCPHLFLRINLGSPKEYLRLYHYLFLDFSPSIASEVLTKHNMELNSKNDKLFIDGIYKLVRDMFGYVPKLTKDQFFQTSFAQIKALMAAEVIEHVQERLKSTTSTTSSITSSSTMSRLINRNLENEENIDIVPSKQESRSHSQQPVQRKPSVKVILQHLRK